MKIGHCGGRGAIFSAFSTLCFSKSASFCEITVVFFLEGL